MYKRPGYKKHKPCFLRQVIIFLIIYNFWSEMVFLRWGYLLYCLREHLIFARNLNFEKQYFEKKFRKMAILFIVTAV